MTATPTPPHQGIDLEQQQLGFMRYGIRRGVIIATVVDGTAEMPACRGGGAASQEWVSE